MDLVKAIVFFTIIAFDVFIPAHSISRASSNNASKPQVLGESTESARIRNEEVRKALGCDYETTCADFCSKTENNRKCVEFFTKTKISTSGMNVVKQTKKTMTPTPFESKTSTATRSSEIANIYRNLEMNIRAIQNSSDSAKEEKIKRIKEEYLKLINGKQAQIPNATDEAKRNIPNKVLEMEKISKEKELFKSRVETIRDAKKKQTVLTISSKIASINKNVTDKMSTALDRLDTILKNLINQTATLKSENKDTLSIETDTVDAQVALTEAQTEVLAQASKEYVLQISSNEATLKESISPMISGLNKEINLVHQSVIKAKDSVIKIYREISELKLPTPTP
ncbi:hypothetical protein HZC27_03270 [Candidatus Roizmanbacteria bacterium]|nr:hypothetical protein [Candidatus Roizmanbacteria bacterium]